MFLRRMKAAPEQASEEPLQRSQSPFGRSTRAPAWTNALPLQAKLTVNQPGDQYEQEADQMAHQVMRTPSMTVQRKGGDVPKTEAPPAVHQALNSPGQPLDIAIRTRMEARFGHDFSGVRVHTNTEAAEHVQARAYTVGQDIFFASGQYEPATSTGQELIAHELVHTIQQTTHGTTQTGVKDPKTRPTP